MIGVDVGCKRHQGLQVVATRHKSHILKGTAHGDDLGVAFARKDRQAALLMIPKPVGFLESLHGLQQSRCFILQGS